MLCKLASGLPGVEASTSYGTPALKVDGKLFARMHQDGESLVLRIDLDARDLVLEAAPDIFFVTAHYLAYPWGLVRLARVQPWELREHLEEAWRTAAPKKYRGDRRP
jgi:hypothetical protein